MTEGGFYQPPKYRKTSIAVVLLLHGAALTALALSKMEIIPKAKPPTRVTLIPNPPDPPPEPVQKEKPQTEPISQFTYVKPVVDPPLQTEITIPPFETVLPPQFPEAASGTGTGPTVEPVPLPEPV